MKKTVWIFMTEPVKPQRTVRKYEKWQQLWNKILKNAIAVWNRMQRYVIKGKGLKEVAYGAGVFQ